MYFFVCYFYIYLRCSQILLIPKHTSCPVCQKPLSKGKIRPVLLHTTVGTLSVKMQNLHCQHTKCDAHVTFHKYTHITNQFFLLTAVQNISWLENHTCLTFTMLDQQLYNNCYGNETHLLSKQCKISGQHTNTPVSTFQAHLTKIFELD